MIEAERETEFNLSPSQVEASDKIYAWYNMKKQTTPIFRCFGYAGTGKTTITRSIIEGLNLDLGREALFAAYTGKAAMVMRKQKLPAGTIHSLIYKPIMPDKKICNKLFADIKNCKTDGQKRILSKQLAEARKVTFELRTLYDSALRSAKLLVLDECSMVGAEMLRDLLTFKIPLLVLGDPGQLPPIHGTGALTKHTPDALLTEIHRQAKDNPIINYATRARNAVPIPYGTMGESMRTQQNKLTNEQVLSTDQILTGKNVTRQKINKMVRDKKGFYGIYPVVGEKLICLRNSPVKGLFNGTMCEVINVGDMLDFSFELEILAEDSAEPIKVKALRAHFDAYEDKEALANVKWWERTDTEEFDFGYAITVHKSQGSQWDNVLIFDDKFLCWKPQERTKWLYTAITRAAKKVIIAD